MRLFVYGTLRRGQAAATLLAGATYVGEAQTAPGFALVDLGDYPAMVCEGSGVVRGEVYDVDVPTLAVLDEHEDCPRLYQRRRVALETGFADAYVMDAGRVVGAIRLAAWPRLPT